MRKLNVLLLCGGGGDEHDISLASAEYFWQKLAALDFVEPHYVQIDKEGTRRTREGDVCELRKSGELVWCASGKSVALDFAIPCLHGYPGETGHIQSVFELMGLPYFGPGPEASQTCFNKVTAKLWLDALHIPNTPFIFFHQDADDRYQRALAFFEQYRGDIFVKAAQQGSSVGVYHVTDASQLEESIDQAFHHSPCVLLEKAMIGRELEVSAYQYKGKLHITPPGEILCPSNSFYDHFQKYSEEGKTRTLVVAPDLSKQIEEKIENCARSAFVGLRLRHLARIDFLLDERGQPWLSEINTLPGHTPISMFPSMLENHGPTYAQFLGQIILEETDRA